MAKDMLFPSVNAYLYDYVGEDTDHITEKKPQVEIIETRQPEYSDCVEEQESGWSWKSEQPTTIEVSFKSRST